MATYVVASGERICLECNHDTNFQTKFCERCVILQFLMPDSSQNRETS